MKVKWNSGNCAKCGVYRYSLHSDHIIPKFKGGVDDSSNIQFLCANCHEDKTTEESTGVAFTPNPSQEQKDKISVSMKKYRASLSPEELSKQSKIACEIWRKRQTKQ